VSSRNLIDQLKDLVADDIRVTINQGLQLRFVRPGNLPYIYSVLKAEGLAAPGFGSTADITACPGTDTCNLGISNSTATALALSAVIEEEFPELLYNKEIAIKISGCMNSCGQHGMAGIGFHGSSLKANGQVLPALQVLVGGAILGSGEARIADKVIKVPSKRGPDVLRLILDDYTIHGKDLSFAAYSASKGERYYYELLKPLADLSALEAAAYIDWGQQQSFSTAIGVGECAGVMIDLVATLMVEADEKTETAKECLEAGAWADSIYHSYSAQIQSAKALLLQKNIQCNTQIGILKDFDLHFTEEGLYTASAGFRNAVMRMNETVPSAAFATEYLQQAIEFIHYAKKTREEFIVADQLKAD
jgi:sulfite reductase (ferredoxin)